jgi:hypothetical protein
MDRDQVVPTTPAMDRDQVVPTAPDWPAFYEATKQQRTAARAAVTLGWVLEYPEP